MTVMGKAPVHQHHKGPIWTALRGQWLTQMWPIQSHSLLQLPLKTLRDGALAPQFVGYEVLQAGYQNLLSQNPCRWNLILTQKLGLAIVNDMKSISDQDIGRKQSPQHNMSR